MNDEPRLSKEQLLRLARQMRTRPLPIMKWSAGDTENDNDYTFRIDGKSVLHSQWMARPDETAGCHLRFRGNKLLERTKTVVLKYSGKPVRPDKLRDRRKWEKNKYSDFPQDPYQLDLSIPLQNIETGMQVLFSTHTEWGRNAILELFEHWARTDHRPIIQLEKQELPTSGDKHIIVGAFNIVSQDENAISDDDVIDLVKDAIVNEPASDEPALDDELNSAVAKAGASDPISTGNGTARSRRNSDMDDDIPF